MSTGQGFLGIFNDVPAAAETDYLHWLTREHTQERLSVPGFLRVRVFRTEKKEKSGYFILYRLRHSDVIASEAYLARLNAPTEWSRRIMPILKDFRRAGGRVVHEAGSGEGSTVLPLVCARPDTEAVMAAMDKIVTMDAIVSARFFESDKAGTAIPTTERATRSGDGTFDALLVVEALTDAALGGVSDALRPIVNLGHSLHYYQIFDLHESDLRPEDLSAQAGGRVRFGSDLASESRR